MLDRRTRTVRRALRAAGWLLLRLLTRTTITGREQLDTPGPVIYAANHASTFDALLFFLRLPRMTVTIGPPLPPVSAPADRRQRQADLEAASVALMQTIYGMLPREAQAHYYP